MIEAALEGLYQVLTPNSLALMCLGVLLGSLVGFLPGIGGPSTLAIMLPFVMTMKDPYAVIALLVGFDAVGNTASAFTAVLISVPGGSGSQATVLDGYPLAKQGQAMRALSASFFASLVGGLIGPIVLIASLPFLRPMVLSFGSPEFFMLTFWGVTMVGVLSGNVPLKGLLAGILGILIAAVGADDKSGIERFTFDTAYLIEGIDLVLVALGVFAIPECIDLAARRTKVAETQELGEGFWQGARDVFKHWWLTLRASAIGIWVGFLPGLGSSVADWFAYAHAVQTEKHPENFGKGDIRGVIAAESSNNSKEAGDYIPTLAFGIPGGTSTALILTALIAVGINPGPEMLTTQLNLTFAVVWTLTIANIVAVAICLAFIKPISRMCFMPFYSLVPMILVFVFIGAFAANRNNLDLIALLGFSFLGFIMRRHGWPRSPLILGLVLGDKMENYLWLSYGRFGFEWLTRPGVMIIAALVVLSLCYPMLQHWRANKDRTGQP
ncbi:MAG TPA: tripartite tricarboxylate transporter permease [Candidatus Limnocylindria bacterium]|nr:tripartite tricarboxylate transporter permease [Candidatus Limnocylindria bacterium]